MLPRYAYHKPFTITFPDKCELVLGCTDGAQEEDTASVLGSTPQVLHAEIHTTNASIMENTEVETAIFSDSQAAIKALESSQINSKLACNCHQSLVKMAEHITGSK
jgi:hypothetical protein